MSSEWLKVRLLATIWFIVRMIRQYTILVHNSPLSLLPLSKNKVPRLKNVLPLSILSIELF